MLNKIYMDLDGVLADFEKKATEVLGDHPFKVPDKLMWPILAKTPDFFFSLEWMPDSQKLWEFVVELYTTGKTLNPPEILTGLPRGNWASSQKIRWCQKYLGKEIVVNPCLFWHKPKKSGPGNVLVDDRTRIREGWEKAGGIFIHHLSVINSIESLLCLTEENS